MKLSPTVRASLELLGVEASATGPELKKAYHRLALLYHPDRNSEPGAAAEFQKITEAYDLLCDPLRVDDLNRRYLRERLHRPVIEGIEITFGTFFGYRVYRPAAAGTSGSLLRLMSSSAKATSASTQERDTFWEPIEENNSILDHPAFDAIEVAYAGRMSLDDEEALKGQIGGSELARLPWVLVNNQGLLRFMDGDLKGARKSYQELCERVPNNIIFTYRLGICLILEGFQKPRRTLLGFRKPDSTRISKGLKLLEHCLKLASARPVGRQKCLVIRKTIADVLEKTGRGRQAQNVWREIHAQSPRCVEAIARVKGMSDAQRALQVKSAQKTAEAASRQLKLGHQGASLMGRQTSKPRKSWADSDTDGSV